MPLHRIVIALLVAAALALVAPRAFAQSPLPDLRVEATDGGSVLHVTNRHTQPLTAFLIELVGYPGSSFSLWHDDPAKPIAAGTVRAFPITNMTVGAVPEYVKMQAGIYADGSTAGVAEKATQIVERRRASVPTLRELIRKLEVAQAANTTADAVVASLNEWSESLPQPARRNRNSQEAINHAATRSILASAVGRLRQASLADVLAEQRAMVEALVKSKPAL